MTDSHGDSSNLIGADARFAPPAQNSDYGFDPLDTQFDQRHDGEFDARHYKATRAEPLLHSEDKESAIGESQGMIVSKICSIAAEDVSTRSRVERSTSSTMGIRNSGKSRHNDSHDPRSESCSQVYLVNEDLNSRKRPAVTKTRTQNEFCPSKECPTRRDLRTSRFTWLNGMILFICSVSTGLSAVFVLLALRGQRYGDYIGNHIHAKMSISTAILWTSVVAKTIELSFVTGFLAFLGQVFSRRAYMDGNRKGVNLAELTMWRWVVQPGSVLTQFEIAKYSGLTSLGILTLISTVLSTLYVTAATALVQPMSKQSDWHSKTMVGSVQAEAANVRYLQSLCQIPTLDEEYGANSCLEIEHAGRSNYNLATFL